MKKTVVDEESQYRDSLCERAAAYLLFLAFVDPARSANTCA
jgi:hypothetical protein